ncbi:glycosyl hydrolase [Shinella sp.]|uniref:glycosyl hydrolase n=1 Tax=Shinella sp. TaxID=1870904 RepID=UPI0029A50C34|nr:glycosyl hydrolase [Shinella sp.]MDX3975768.1 glycosyl hydrolase [Shinella sp.]
MQRALTVNDLLGERGFLHLDRASLWEDSFIFMTMREREAQVEFSRSSSPEEGSTKTSSSGDLKNPFKVGIGTWDIDSKATAIKDLDIFDFNWYTDWSPDPLWSPRGLGLADARFVPMIWGKADLTTTNIKALQDAKSGYLLGFNEPDNKDQANMTVTEAIKLWPKLMRTGLELGSPACTTDQTLGKDSWLGKFMNLAEKKGYEIDFVAVHYYSENPSIADFKKFLKGVQKAYDKPVWVTEWALVDWENPNRFNPKEIAAFAAAATRMMDGLDFVKRHAWFGAYDGGDGWHINTQLLDAHGELTKVGEIFHDFLM